MSIAGSNRKGAVGMVSRWFEATNEAIRLDYEDRVEWNAGRINDVL
jgi:hypothetical protein